MGNYNSTWAVYARELTSSQYQASPLWEVTAADNVWGMWKHTVYEMSLGLDCFATYKAIYLYNGMWRYAKLERLDDNHHRLTLQSTECCTKYHGEKETLPPKQWGLREYAFQSEMVMTVSDPNCPWILDIHRKKKTKIV